MGTVCVVMTGSTQRDNKIHDMIALFAVSLRSAVSTSYLDEKVKPSGNYANVKVLHSRGNSLDSNFSGE